MCPERSVTYVSGPDILKSGAGDGNRTHVRSLGSFYTAIVRRPLSFEITRDSSVGTSAPFAKTRVASPSFLRRTVMVQCFVDVGCRFGDSDENAVRMILPT